VCSAGNPALVAAPTRKNRPRSKPTVTGLRSSKMSLAFSGRSGIRQRPLEALRVNGWGSHPVIDLEVGTVLIG
jgi:hypothetical protein